MRRVFAVLAVLGISAVAAAQHGAGYSGGQANYSTSSGYSAGRGGEFRLETTGTGMLLSRGAYAASTRNVGNASGTLRSFQTFCIEFDETLREPMDLWVSTQNALLSGPGSHAWLGGANTNGGDDLDSRTAYLYYRFAVGNLPGYNYTVGANRARSAAILQRVLWSVEEEDGGAAFSTPFGDITLSAAEQAQANAWLNLATTFGHGLKGVRVLQTTRSSDGSNAQDLLYLTVPVPGAALLGVLGLGIAGWVKRRMA